MKSLDPNQYAIVYFDKNKISSEHLIKVIFDNKLIVHTDDIPKQNNLINDNIIRIPVYNSEFPVVANFSNCPTFQISPYSTKLISLDEKCESCPKEIKNHCDFYNYDPNNSTYDEVIKHANKFTIPECMS